jgi:hypothetical protein
MDFLQTLSQSAFSRWVSESGSLLGYPTILFLHTLGLGTVAGLSAGIDLRLLGFAPSIPVAPLRRLFPTMWVGFVVSALSGLALLVADPVTRLVQVVFYVKLLFVALAVATMQLLWTRIFRDAETTPRPLPANARTLALISIFFWLAATTAGRLIAYIN